MLQEPLFRYLRKTNIQHQLLLNHLQLNFGLKIYAYLIIDKPIVFDPDYEGIVWVGRLRPTLCFA